MLLYFLINVLFLKTCLIEFYIYFIKKKRKKDFESDFNLVYYFTYLLSIFKNTFTILYFNKYEFYMQNFIYKNLKLIFISI